jgi:hypothetical protein
MSKAGYSAPVGSPVLLAPAVSYVVAGALAPASFGLDWTSYSIAFDGVSATNAPVLVELCTCTFATNPPGTNSTSITIQQEYGPVIPAGFTAAYAWTTGNQPTVITPFDQFTLTPNGGLLIRDIYPGRVPNALPSTGFCIRCTAGFGVNARGGMKFERC